MKRLDLRTNRPEGGGTFAYFPRRRLACGGTADGGELRPVAGINFEGGAEASDNAAAVRDKAHKLEIGERRDDVHGGAELCAKGGNESGVGGGIVRDRLSVAREGQAGAREGLRSGGLGLDQQHAGTRGGAEITRVGGETADVDHEGAIGVEEGGGDGGVWFTVGGGGGEHDGE